MKIILPLLSTLLLSPAFAIQIGDRPPDFGEKLKNVDGAEKSLSAWLTPKKVNVVIFSCNHCPYVKAWEDRMVEIGRAFMPKGVSVLLVNSNDPEKVKEDALEEMKKRAESKKYPFPYLSNPTSTLAKAFGATRTPEVFVFNDQMKLVYHGAVDDSSDPENVKDRYLTNALAALTAGKPVDPKETKFIGCTIKFR